MKHAATTARTVAIVACLVVASALPAVAHGRAGHGAPPLAFQPPAAFAHVLQPPPFVAGEVIVRYAQGSSSRQQSRVRARVAAHVERPLLAHMQLLQLRRGESVAGAVRRLNRTPGVAYAEPNFVRTALAVPNDPMFGKQWAMQNTGQVTQDDDTGKDVTGTPGADIRATAAWDITTGSRAVRVGVLDSGMLYDHPDLRPNLGINLGEYGNGKESNGIDDDHNGFVDDWRGWDFTGRTGNKPDNNPLDVALHGTHVAGTIAAVGNNGIGVTGVAWQASLVPLKFIDDNGFGTVAKSIEAYAYARANGIRIVNGSFGGPEHSRAEYEALRASPDVLFVFAAGNDGVSNDQPVAPGDATGVPTEKQLLAGPPPSFPAAYARSLPNVMAVAASTTNDGRASFTNYGRRSVDLAAPGTSIFSTFRATPLFEDQFLSDLQGRWTRGGSKSRWSWDNLFHVLDSNPVAITWNCSDASPGGNVRVCNGAPHGRYENDSNAVLQQAAPMQLGGRSGCVLHMSEFHDLQQGHDFFLVEGSRDGGATWQRIGKPRTGNGGGLESLDLSQFDGAQQLLVRLRMTSDAAVGGMGVHLFSLWVDTCQPQQYEYDKASGSSMAAPHVSGAAALVYALHPDADPAWVRQAIDNGAAVRDAWIGRTRTGGRLDVRGALDAAAAAGMRLPIEFTETLPRRDSLLAYGRPVGFAWQRSGADSGIARYELYVDGALERTLGRSADTVRIAAALTRGRHTWRVDAVDRDGDRRAGETRAFTLR